MGETSSCWLEVMLRKHVRENSVAKVVNVEIEPAVPKGENYASVLDRARVTVIMGSGRTTTKCVIIKRLPERELHSKFLVQYSLFKIETKVYADVLSEMEYLMLEYGDMDEKLWPDFVGHKAYDTIIFNDLKEMNYSVVDRKEMLDKTHAFLAIRSIARYHAMSILIYKRGIINSGDFEPYFFASNTRVANNLVKGGAKTLATVMKSSWGPEWAEVSDRIMNAIETCGERLEELRQIDETKLNVLNHGDFWTCNMMFKYSPCSGHDYPIGIRFVDFQMSHWNSYAFDLTYFLNCAVKPELRRNQYDKLLEAYHESLLATLKFYRYSSPRIPTLEEVKREVKRLAFFGFITMASSLPVTSAEGDNALDLEKIMLEGDDSIGFNPEIYNSDFYKKAVQPELKEFMRNGVI